MMVKVIKALIRNQSNLAASFWHCNNWFITLLIQAIGFKLLSCSFRIVLSVIVLFKGGLPCIRTHSFCLKHGPFSIPADEKHHLNIMLPLACFGMRMMFPLGSASFVQNSILCQGQKCEFYC